MQNDKQRMHNAHTQSGYIKVNSYPSSQNQKIIRLLNFAAIIDQWHTMARKQSIEETESLEMESLDAVDKPVSSANIHGIVTSLSPIKKGRTRNYFDGTVSDSTSKLRMVGFNVKQRTAINDFLERKEPIEIRDCQIQARRGYRVVQRFSLRVNIFYFKSTCTYAMVTKYA